MRVEPVHRGPWPVEEIAEVLVDRLDLSRPEAHGVAIRLRDVFCWRFETTDDQLDKGERALMWRLLVQGVVTTETHTRPHPEHGRPWRYHHWKLVPPGRLVDRSVEVEEQAKAPPEIGVYTELPADVWERRVAQPA